MLTYPYNNLEKSMYQQPRGVHQTTLKNPMNLSKIQQEDWRTDKARQWPDLGQIKTIFAKGHTICILLKFFRISSFCFLNMEFSGPLKSEPVVSCASVTRCNILPAVLLVITAHLLQVSHFLCSLDIAIHVVSLCNMFEKNSQKLEDARCASAGASENCMV